MHIQSCHVLFGVEGKGRGKSICCLSKDEKQYCYVSLSGQNNAPFYVRMQENLRRVYCARNVRFVGHKKASLSLAGRNYR